MHYVECTAGHTPYDARPAVNYVEFTAGFPPEADRCGSASYNSEHFDCTQCKLGRTTQY